MLRGVGAGWNTILFVFLFLLFKKVLISPAAVVSCQADCTGTVEWYFPTDYGLKEGKGHSSKNTEQAPLLHAATVALPPLPSPGGCPFPNVPGKGMAGRTTQCLTQMKASFLFSWFRLMMSFMMMLLFTFAWLCCESSIGH